MIAALALSLSLVTFDTLAARVPVVLEKLSAVVGQKLECDASFTNEVVVVHVKGVEPKELLDKFAFANVAVWRKEEDKFVLVPDAKRRAEQEKELLEKRVNGIQRILDTFKEELAKPYTPEAIAATIAALKPRDNVVTPAMRQAEGPGQRLDPLARLGMNAVIMLGADRLSQIRDGQRIVFSSEPTAMQEKWSGSDRLMKDFIREWAVFNEEVNKAPAGKRLAGLAWEARYGVDVDPRTMTSVGKIWVSISDLLSTRSVNPVVVGVASPSGQLSIGKGVNIHVPTTREPPPEVPDLPTAPLKFNESSLEMISFRRGVSDNQHVRSAVKISENLRRLLDDPVKNDPHVFTSELYGQYADVRERNLIAVVNDGAFQRFLFSSAPDARSFHQRSMAGFKFTESGRWLIMTPSLPVEARRNRDNRVAMRELVRSMSGDNSARLKARCVYALQRPYGFLNGLGAIIAESLSPVPLPPLEDGDEDVLRLYGSLNPEQEAGLKRGKALTFYGLTVRQRALINRMIFGEQIQQWSMELGAPPPPDSGDDRLWMAGPWNEATNRLPNGIPDEAPLSLLSHRINDLALHSSTVDARYHFTGSPGSAPALSKVARQIFYDQHPELSATIRSDLSLKPDLFTAIDRLQLTFDLILEPQLMWRGKLRSESPLTGRVKLEQLPEDHKKAIETEVARFNEMLKNGVNFGSGPPNAPPKKQPPPH